MTTDIKDEWSLSAADKPECGSDGNENDEDE